MSAKARPALIRSINLFSELGNDDCAELADHVSMEKFQAGSAIVGRNDQDDSVFFIVSGDVRVTSFSSSGRETSFHDKGVGEYFGELAAMDGNPRAADVVAIGDASLLRMSGADFRSLVENNSSVNRKLTHQLIAGVRALTQRVYEFSVLKVQSRIQMRILELALKSEAQGDRVLIRDFPKHSDIASRVATTREAVTREISRLHKLGLIERAENGVVVPNLSRFTTLVED